MAIDYNDSIQFLDNGIPPSYLSELPDTCPICSYAVSPEYILTYTKDRITTELLCAGRVRPNLWSGI